MAFLGNNPPLVDKAAIGLDQVDNTPDLSKPISTAVQSALDAKQAALVSGTNVKTLNGQSVLGAGDLSFTAEPVISKITLNGYNAFMMLVEGVIYRTSGGTASYAASQSGAEASGAQNEHGMNSLKPIVLPTSSPVLDMDISGNGVAYALCANGELYTWGANSSGQCGLGSTVAIATPTLAATGVTRVFAHPTSGAYSVNNSRLIIQKDDGYLYGAGYNGNGHLGTGNTTNATSFTRLDAFGTNPINVWVLGNTYGCMFVQKSDGTLWACGYNGFGELGVGNTTATIHPTDVTSAWLGGYVNPEILDLTGAFGYYNTAAGGESACVMLIDTGTSKVIKTCGVGTYGTLGNGGTANISLPYTVSLPADVEELVVGSLGSVYARLSDNRLYVWGRNTVGQLGIGNTTQQNSPVAGPINCARLPMKSYEAHTYGYVVTMFYVATTGELYATGQAAQGQGGNGGAANLTAWTKVLVPTSSSNTFKMVAHWETSANGGSIIVGIRDDNKIFAWGFNGHNGVRSGNTSNVLTPNLFKLDLY